MQLRNIAIAVLVVLSLSYALPAQQHCSMRYAVGTWAMSLSGWDMPTGQSTPAPETMLAVLSVEPSGRVTGSGTSILGTTLAGIPAGQPLDWDIVDASIQVNEDCTGFFTYSIQLKGLGLPPFGPNIDRLVIVPRSDQIIAMRIQSPLSKPMEVYTLYRMRIVPTTVSWPPVPAQ